MSRLAELPPTQGADHTPARAGHERRVDEAHSCPCCGEAVIYTPRIQCSHCGKELNIRCYVFRKHGNFYAECLTLNIISRGATQGEAIVRLQRAMASYVETVFSEPQSTKGLIPRPAPAASWVRYYVHRALRKLAASIWRKPGLVTKSTPAPDATQYRFAEC